MSNHGSEYLGNHRTRRNASTYYSGHSGNHYSTNHHDNVLSNGSYGDDYYYDYYGDFIDYDYPEDRATTTINYVAPPILLIVGVTTNALSCIIMTRLATKTLSTCVNLAFLSVCDILLLINRCGSIWVTQITGAEYDVVMVLVSKSNEFCQVYSFLSNLLIHWCSWLLAVALAEACLFTRRPLQIHKLATRERSKNTLLFVLLLSIVVNAHYFWTYGLQEEYYFKGVYWCQFTTVGSYYSESFRQYLWPILDLLMSTLVPGTVMVFCMGDIIRIRTGCCAARKKSRKKLQQKIVVVDTMPQNRKSTFYDNAYLMDPESCDTFVYMCLFLGVYCTILSLPETVFSYVIDFLIIERLGYTSDTGRFEAKRSLGRTLCLMFRDILLSTKAFIYLTWPTFRTAIRDTFRCKKEKKKQKQIPVDSDQSFKEPLTRGHRDCEANSHQICNTVTVV